MKTPRPYQIKSILAAIDRNTLIADECGLGKTLQAVIAVDRYQDTLRDGLASTPVLVVCKKRARQQWSDEIAELTQRAAIMLDKPPDQPIRAPIWIITHYEALLNTDRWWKNGLWAAFILDEAHYIKNAGSHRNPVQRTHAVKQIKAMRKIALTGTPIDSSAAEAWSILNWLYPQRFRSYWQFFDRFANYEYVWIGAGKRAVKSMPGTRDPDGFASEIADFTFQRTKAQVLPDLPPKTFQTVRIPLDGRQKMIYDAIDQSTDIECKIPGVGMLFISNQLASITYKQEITSHPGILRVEGELLKSNAVKYEWLIDYLTDNSTTPMVVFTRFDLTATYIKQAVSTLGRTNVMVGTIDDIGESLNLQWASIAIFYDVHWSSIKMTQAIDRIHRMNITEPKHIIYLIAQDTIDEDILTSFTNKWTEQELIRYHVNQQSTKHHG